MTSPYPLLDIVTGVSLYTSGYAVPEPTLARQERYGILVTDQAANGTNAFVDQDPYVGNFVGRKEPSFFEDLYFRIHVTPGKIALGNVLSVQTEEVKLWNAHLSSKDMTDYVEPVQQGISVSEPVAAPYTLKALEELTYVVTVDAAGPPQFSATIEWTIAGELYNVEVTGQRVVVWPFGPNWDQPVTESLEWRTDVLTAFDGSEDRIPLRSKPRRSISYAMSLHGNELNQFQNLLFGWQDRQYALPVWFDRWTLQTEVPAGAVSIPVETDGRGFSVGKLAILMTDTYTFEVFEVDVINSSSIQPAKPLESSWPRHARLYPVNLARLPTSLPTSRETSQVMRANVEWRTDPVDTDPYIPALPAAEVFDGHEIIYRKPNWSTPVQYDSENEYDFLDFETGAAQMVPRPHYPRQIRRVQWLLKSRLDVKDFRALLGRMKGRYVSAYVPTWFPDFELAATTGAGSSALTVKRSQYSSLVGVQGTQSTVLIRLTNGTRYIRKIIGSTVPNPETETLSLNDTVPVELNKDNVLMISLVHLCRLQADGVTINYQSDSVATVEMQTVTVNA